MLCDWSPDEDGSRSAYTCVCSQTGMFLVEHFVTHDDMGTLSVLLALWEVTWSFPIVKASNEVFMMFPLLVACKLLWKGATNI